MSRELNAAIRAAKAAGKVIMSYYGKQNRVKLKSPRLGIVTEADFASQRKIKSVILKSFPKAVFLAEEDKKRPQVYDNVWVVDPLDGTKNFSRGIKSFAVSIAFVKKRKPVVGVVFDPAAKEMFYAEKGKGAFLNGKRIRVSGVKKMEAAVFDLPLSNRKGMREKGMRILKKLMRRLGVIRIIGAAALRLSFIASARFDAYVEYGAYSWDIAAGTLILKEAGGKVTDEKGRPSDVFKSRTIVASNGKIHSQIIRELNR